MKGVEKVQFSCKPGAIVTTEEKETSRPAANQNGDNAAQEKAAGELALADGSKREIHYKTEHMRSPCVCATRFAPVWSDDHALVGWVPIGTAALSALPNPGGA